MRPLLCRVALSVSVVCGCTAERASVGPPGVDIPLHTHATATPRQGPIGEAPPGPLAARDSPFPAVKRTTLPNGLVAVVAEAHALLLVQIRVTVGAGNGYGAMPGVATLTG